ncbi:MAG TPA: BrnT family toxin [Rhizomicrobium sp.]|jgi:hypothetical protein|nr:BrnT family toxin [Rhizomicrobium sp.]
MLTFEWDDEKAQANYRKHGIAFEMAVAVFHDPLAMEIFDPDSGEDRFVIIGQAELLVLAVVYTERGENIRLISARRATRKEHDAYYRENSQN